MTSFFHRQTRNRIKTIDEIPKLGPDKISWHRGDQHLNFLVKSIDDIETIVYAASDFSFIYALIVPNNLLSPPNQTDLMKWSCNPYHSAAGYAWGSGRDPPMWVEMNHANTGSNTLNEGVDLIYGRSFEGLEGEGSSYFELNQALAHLFAVHWRNEHSSYCKFDANGDLEEVVSISKRADGDGLPTLVSIQTDVLHQYMAITNSSLVRMFDFTLVDHKSFSGWPDHVPEFLDLNDDYFYRQLVTDQSAYFRGIQIVRPRLTALHASKRIAAEWRGTDDRHVTFVAQDWRNDQIANISTAPNQTTNYFDAKSNSLPFELSPAFFRPEVLLKYKADREKYSLGERELSCRSAWSLRGFDINEAGQVHAYICDLRTLPYSEKLHWLSYNVPPKAPISSRAITNDFKGEIYYERDPLQKLKQILQRWIDKRIDWWIIRDNSLLGQLHAPVSNSKDEWGEAFLMLSQLIVEGFVVKVLRQRLSTLSCGFQQDEKSIQLLERICASKRSEETKLTGLRTIQRIRSKAKGHAGRTEADELARRAVAEQGSYRAHFNSVCLQAVEEIQLIEHALSVE